MILTIELLRQTKTIKKGELKEKLILRGDLVDSW